MRTLRRAIASVQAIVAAIALVVIPSAPTDGAGYPCGTPGKDGSPSLGGTPNTYWAGSGSPAAGSTTITLGTRNANGSAVLAKTGDMLLLVQTQGASISTTNSAAYGNGSTGSGWTGTPVAGSYEFVIVRNAPALGADTGSSVTIASAGGGGLVNKYVSAAATAGMGQETWQIVRVPQYLNFTASGPLYTARWDGASGGVISLDVAKTLTLSSAINADGYGFRGGGQNVWGKAATTVAPSSWTANKGAVTDYVYPINPIIQSLAGFTYTSGTSFDGGPDGFKGEGIAGTPAYTYASGDAATVKAASWGYPGGDKARGAPGNAGGGATDSNVTGVQENPNANTWNSGGGGGGNGGAGGIGGKNWDGTPNNGSTSIVSSEGLGGAAWPASVTSIVMGGGGGAGSNNDGSTSTRSIPVGVVLNSGTSVTATLTGGAPGQTAYTGTPPNDTYGALAGVVGRQVTGVSPSSIPGARSGAECSLLLLAKRVTTFNVTPRSAFVNDNFTDANNGQLVDANTNWPWSCAPAWSCGGNPQIFGTLTEAPKPGDTLEYTIYFVSAGGNSVQFSGSGVGVQGICDYVPATTTIVAAQYGGKPMQVTLGFTTPTPTNYGQVGAAGQTGYYAIVAGAGNPIPLPTACGAVPAGAPGAVFFSAASLAPYPTNDGGFGKIRFTVKQT